MTFFKLSNIMFTNIMLVQKKLDLDSLNKVSDLNIVNRKNVIEWGTSYQYHD